MLAGFFGEDEDEGARSAHLGSLFDDEGLGEGEEGDSDDPGPGFLLCTGPKTPPSARPRAAIRGEKELAGLKNQGGTCYLNSLLQVLYMLPEFKSAIYSLDPEEDLGLVSETSQGLQFGMRSALRELQGLFARMDLSLESSISTVDLTKNAFSWTDGQGVAQHDVHELVSKLLERLHSELAGTPQQALIRNTFIGNARENAVKCASCGFESGRGTPFMTLFARVQGCSKLEESFLAQYKGEPEKLNGNNAYKCEGCGDITDKELSQSLTHLPPCLFINLNRFTFNYKTLKRQKVSTRFEFPTSLKMNEFLSKDDSATKFEKQEAPDQGEPENELTGSSSENEEEEMGNVYDLVGILSHAGSGYAGHYISYVRVDVLDPKFAEGKMNEEDEKIDRWRVVEGKKKKKRHGGCEHDRRNNKKGPAVLPNKEEWGVWYTFNDSHVRRIATEEIAHTFAGRSCAYILLYRKRNNLDPGNLKDLVPRYWRDRIEAENNALMKAWDDFEQISSSREFLMLRLGKEMIWDPPHFKLASSIKEDKLNDNLVTVDIRLSVHKVYHVLKNKMEDCDVFLVLSKLTGPGQYALAPIEPKNEDVLEDFLTSRSFISGTILVCSSSEADGIPVGDQAQPVEFIVREVLQEGESKKSSLFVSKGESLEGFVRLLEVKHPESFVAPLMPELELSTFNKAELGSTVGEMLQVTSEIWIAPEKKIAKAELSHLASLCTIYLCDDTPDSTNHEFLEVSFDKNESTLKNIVELAMEKLNVQGETSSFALISSNRAETSDIVDDKEMLQDKSRFSLIDREAWKVYIRTIRGKIDRDSVVTMKLSVVSGNDPSSLLCVSVGEDTICRSDHIVLKMKASHSLDDVKAEVAGRVSGFDKENCRFRLTNWAEEAQELLPDRKFVSNSHIVQDEAFANELFRKFRSFGVKIWDEDSCYRAYQALGGAVEKVEQHFEWAHVLDESMNGASNRELFRKWWMGSGPCFDECSCVSRTIEEVYSEIQSAEVLLLEEGKAPIVDALSLSVHFWNTHSATSIFVCDASVGVDEATICLRRALLRALANLICGHSEGNFPNLTVDLSLALMFDHTLIRTLVRSDVLSRDVPGDIFNPKATFAKINSGRALGTYPIPIIIQASQWKLQSKTLHNIWLAEFDIPEGKKNAVPISINNIVGQSSLTEAIKRIKHLLGSENVANFHFAFHDPSQHKWNFFDLSQPIGPPKGQKQGKKRDGKKSKGKGSQRKNKGQTVKHWRQGNVVAYMRKDHPAFQDCSEPREFAQRFDTKADERARKLQQELDQQKADSRKARKLSTSSKNKNNRRQETELKLGNQDLPFSSTFFN